MIVFIALLGILCLYGISVSFIPTKTRASAPYFKDYLSPDKTNSIKGIFILFVVFSHSMGYYTLSDSIADSGFNYIISILGQSMVAPFLFYSGYGIMYSVEKKGQAYVKRLPVHRFLKVLLHFDIAVLLFAALGCLLGRDITPIQLLAALTGWDSVGNSNWYIFDVLCLYLLTFTAFTLFKRNRKYGALCLFVLTVGLMLLLRYFKSMHWYDTLPCYSLGISFYYLHEPVEALFGKRKWLYWLTEALLLIGCFAFIYIIKGEIFTILRHLLFMCALVLLTMKVSVHNKALSFLGKHLFGIYILQRVPMMLLAQFGVSNSYVFLLLTLIVVIPLAYGFEFLLGKLDKTIFKEKKGSRWGVLHKEG